MKKILSVILIASLTSCLKVNVETDGVARETGSLIRDGVKGGIELYKESKKDTTNKHDTTSIVASTYKKLKNKLKK